MIIILRKFFIQKTNVIVRIFYGQKYQNVIVIGSNDAHIIIISRLQPFFEVISNER